MWLAGKRQECFEFVTKLLHFLVSVKVNVTHTLFFVSLFLNTIRKKDRLVSQLKTTTDIHNIVIVHDSSLSQVLYC